MTLKDNKMFEKSFASDNYAGVHPHILEAIQLANQGHCKAYGEDAYTQQATELLKEQFGPTSEIYLVCNGTAANILSLSSLVRPYQGVICAESAHINGDECGAPEKNLGSKLLTVPAQDGKLTVESIKKFLIDRGDQHRVQPKAISITQCTEFGTLYSLKELKDITDFAHAHQFFVHMDGSRLSNAAASLKTDLVSLTQHAGIDVLSFGGTKNGLMFGEAVIFFQQHLAKDFPYIRKQNMQLISKMRFLATQFIALFTDNLWLKNAQQANAMAQLLAESLQNIPAIKLTQKVESNAVFATLSPSIIARLQEKYAFYVWNESKSEVRWMTSWDTTEEDIQTFSHFIRETAQKI